MGFQGIRSLAVMVAAGLDSADGAPDGFRHAAALCATGGEIVAPMIGANAGDAFSVGLLHLIGTAVLHQSREPGSTEEPVTMCLPALCDPEQLVTLERSTFGLAHDDLGAEMLAGWRFPDHLCQVIASHHRAAMADAPPLERTLQIARLLADAVLQGDEEVTAGADVCAWLSEGVIGQSMAVSIAERMRVRAEALLDGLHA
jgi:HD-like signal output (HDOD) protein